MSTRTVTFTHRVGLPGTLTNATSVALSDPGGTFGVKRNDTSAVVVADATAMTNTATGIYSYAFTEPAAGLSYTAYVEWVYGGETYRVEKQLAAMSESSVFGTRAGIEQKVGVQNLAVYADLNNTQDATEIAAAIADDLTEAATDMRIAWREFSAETLAYETATEARWLADTNEYGAAVKAWAGRNVSASTQEEVPQNIATALAEWERRLQMLRDGTVLLDYQDTLDIPDPTEWGAQDAPVAVDATVDRDGREISELPARGAYWDANAGAYRWS